MERGEGGEGLPIGGHEERGGRGYSFSNKSPLLFPQSYI